jgi:hypothetical protein
MIETDSDLLQTFAGIYMRLLSFCSERLSAGQNSLITGKIQGNFADLTAKAGRRLDFPTISQLITPKFPAHLNREFYRANRELFPAEQ